MILVYIICYGDYGSNIYVEEILILLDEWDAEDCMGASS